MATENRTALITGAGSGIGRATAETLAQMGFRVALVGRDAAKLDAARNALPDGGKTSLILPCDVADRPAVDAMVEQVLKAFGHLDVVVCNAGTNVKKRSLEQLDPVDWDRIVAVILTGAYNVVHAVLPSMRQRQSGLVVQISSISGMRSSPLGGIAYSAAKFGQAALGICLGREERERGIRSTVIYPGEVNTPILEARPTPVDPKRLDIILQPEDVAATVRFLVELPSRARIPEMVILPAIDDFA